MKKRILCAFLGATISAAALGQGGTQSGAISPYSQYGLGMLADQSLGFNRGMGGTGLAMRQGTLVNPLNPASYSAVDSLTMLFDVSLSLQQTNFKEKGTSVNARNADFDYAAGLFRIRKNLGVSFGLLPFSSIGYSYNASSYLNNTIGSITENFTGSGGFHQFYVGAGWSPIKPLSIGFNMAYLWGNYSRTASSTASPTVNSLSKLYKANVSSYNLSFGIQWSQPLGQKNNLTLGIVGGIGHKLGADATCDIVNLNTSTSVSDTTHFVVRNGLELPMSYGIGLAWVHDQKLTVAADVSLQKWGSLDFPAYDETKKQYVLQGGLLSDRTRMSVGADYVPDPNHPTNYLKHVHLRAGVYYATPYYKLNGQDGPKELGLSAGLGLPLLSRHNIDGGLRPVLNISAQWVHTAASGFITDNTFRINVGLTFNERWFAKWRIN